MFSQWFTITQYNRFKTYFISWNMILKLKSFTRIGTYIFHKKFLTTRVPVNFLDGTRYFTSIYRLHTQLWRYNTRKYSLGELILLAKSKEYTLLYIMDKFQGVWMTNFFRMSVFHRSLSFIKYKIRQFHVFISAQNYCIFFIWIPLCQLDRRNIIWASEKWASIH